MSLDVLDWRRRTAALYELVRAELYPPVAHAGWAASREDLFRTHPASPVQDDGYDLPVAAYDPQWRAEVALEDAPPERIEVPTGTDGVVPFERIGRVRLGDLGRVDVWWLDSYGGGVFLPLRDGSAGAGTYGGGRYLLDTVKGADLGGGGGRLVVDLNFAYHPSCAYDPRWSCPLAPEGNRLTVPVAAGEQLPPDGWY